MRKLAAMFATLGLCATMVTGDDSTLKIKVGDKFPDVPLAAAQVEKLPGKKSGDLVAISDLKGKSVIVFFYPKALTSGCTVESCGFRDLIKELPENALVLGASADDVPLQQKFIDTNKLPYPLLADTQMKLIKELGIVSPKNAKMPQRITFVVDKDGKVAKIYNDVNVKSHPKDVVDFVKSQK